MSENDNSGKDPIAVLNETLTIERNSLKEQLDALQEKFDALTIEHERALKILDMDNRATIAKYLLKATRLTAGELAKFTTEELKQKMDAIELLKIPVAGVGFAGDQFKPKPSGLTVGSWDGKKWVA